MLTVTITQEDIDNGQKHKIKCCPVALAANRTFPGKEFIVCPYYIACTEEDMLIEYNSPGLYTFVRDFDQGLPVEPTTFNFKQKRRYPATP